jgi:oligoendopeptidase F
MRDGYLDLGGRPNKASSNESWFFSQAGIPYIHVASGNAGSIFHESGHGIHDYLSFQAHGALWNFNGPEVFQEFAATSMDMLCWPYYAQAKGGLFSPSETAKAQQNIMQLYLGFCSITCVIEDAFEHWLYGEAPEDVTSADLDAKWLELKARFEPWDDDYPNEDEKMTGWQRNTWSLFRMPFYMTTYSMAMVGTCQLARLAETDRATVIHNYKTALALGNTQPLPELFRVVGLTFPFTEQAVEEAIQFVLNQSLEIMNR